MGSNCCGRRPAALKEEDDSVFDHRTDNPNKYTKKPLELRVSARVENINDINTISQTFKAKIYFEVFALGAAADAQLQEVLEARYFSKVSFRNTSDNVDEKLRDICVRGDDVVLRWDVVCTFDERMELVTFPFDNEELQVHFTIHNANEGDYPVKLLPMPEVSGINTRTFALRNVWHLLPKLSFMLEDTDPDESGSRKTYPVLRIIVCVQRRTPYYMWNVAIPMCTFVVMSFMAYAVDNKSPADRMALSLTLVLTAAAYKNVVSGMLPAVGYMTLLDRYVMWCMLFLFLVVVEHGLCSSGVFSEFDYYVTMLLVVAFSVINLIFLLEVLCLQCLRFSHRVGWLSQRKRADD